MFDVAVTPRPWIRWRQAGRYLGSGRSSRRQKWAGPNAPSLEAAHVQGELVVSVAVCRAVRLNCCDQGGAWRMLVPTGNTQTQATCLEETA